MKILIFLSLLLIMPFAMADNVQTFIPTYQLATPSVVAGEAESIMTYPGLQNQNALFAAGDEPESITTHPELLNQVYKPGRAYAIETLYTEHPETPFEVGWRI